MKPDFLIASIRTHSSENHQSKKALANDKEQY